jgi:hypothetical protein
LIVNNDRLLDVMIVGDNPGHLDLVVPPQIGVLLSHSRHHLVMNLASNLNVIDCSNLLGLINIEIEFVVAVLPFGARVNRFLPLSQSFLLLLDVKRIS